MSGGFEGKVAIVTGGTQGLARGDGLPFVERGARGVVICGRNAEKGERVRADLAAAGAEVASSQPISATSTRRAG
ncbi:MAG: hypothetical protein R3C69_03580 [Geminicoccaceae bacterium]